ncbi:MAG: SDR family NAD(P)-dependent oxidoreductase [Anaerolineales bacterium]|jgi:2-hydroxycyclohexanecarboxyl-CoA dehydrogenase
MSLLDGKVAVVTGAGRGVGRAVAMAFASHGALVALAARSADEINSTAEEIGTAGGQALAIPTDVAQPADVKRLFDETRGQFGPISILVNNAAIIGPTGMLWDVDLDAWQEILDINVLSIVRCCRAVLPGMIEQRYGKIINVGSDAGWREGWAAQFSEQAAYGTSKAAIIRFSELLAHQVKRHGVNVNCLGVSAHTRMGYEANMAMSQYRGTELPSPYEDITLEKRVLPEENVGAFVFLASSLSDHVTGAYFEANRLPSLLLGN